MAIYGIFFSVFQQLSEKKSCWEDSPYLFRHFLTKCPKDFIELVQDDEGTRTRLATVLYLSSKETNVFVTGKKTLQEIFALKTKRTEIADANLKRIQEDQEFYRQQEMAEDLKRWLDK